MSGYDLVDLRLETSEMIYALLRGFWSWVSKIWYDLVITLIGNVPYQNSLPSTHWDSTEI